MLHLTDFKHNLRRNNEIKAIFRSLKLQSIFSQNSFFRVSRLVLKSDQVLYNAVKAVNTVTQEQRYETLLQRFIL